MIRRLEGPELAAYDLIDPHLAARIRVVKVPMLTPGADGITIGRWVFLRNDDDRSGGRELLAHELVHARQYREQGLARFLLTYIRGYLHELRSAHNHYQAYLAISYEREARTEAAAWAQRRW